MNQEIPIKDIAVCFSITIGRFSIKKRVQSDRVEVDADKDKISVTKQILDSEKYREIVRLDHEIRQYLQRRSLPSLLRRGIYLLPLKSVKEVESAVAGFQKQRADRIQAFIDEYAEAREYARLKLRSLFDPEDYPAVELVQASFIMETRIFSAEVPEALSNISAIAYEREKERAKRFWEDSQELIMQVLRSEFSELVDHLVDRLTADEKGKPKIFKNSIVRNFEEWATLFENRNLADDQALKEQVGKARALLSGVSPDDLRSIDTTRDRIRKGFETIKQNTAQWVINKPSRMISLDE